MPKRVPNLCLLGWCFSLLAMLFFLAPLAWAEESAMIYPVASHTDQDAQIETTDAVLLGDGSGQQNLSRFTTQRVARRI